MTAYTNTKFSLSDNQRQKIRRAMKNHEPVTIEVTKSQINGSDTLKLTNSQLQKLTKLAAGKGMQIKMSKTQVSKQRSQEPELLFTMSKTDATKAQAAIEKLLANQDKIKTGGFLGAIGKLALPFVKNILPKVLASLSLAAASGAISGSTHKATSGRGLRRAGYGIKLTENEIQKLLKLASACERQNIIPEGTVCKYTHNIKEQKGGFIGALIASLAGSLLPSLLSGKGVYRAGSKK